MQEHESRVHVFSCSVFDDNQDFIAEIDKISKQNSILSMRIFDLVIKLACVSPEHLINISENKLGLSRRINQYLQDQDILSQLNCIELMIDFVRTNHGYEFLAKSGHLRHLVLNLLIENQTNPFAEFLRPALVKLFSYIAKERPEEVKKNYAQYFDFLFCTIQTSDLINNLQDIILVVESFCFLFTRNYLKKFFLNNYYTEFDALLSKMVWFLTHSINDKLKENVILCLSELISIDSFVLKTDEPDTKWLESAWNSPEWIDLSHSIYKNVLSKISHENLFNICFSLAKKPFIDLRLASHLYLKSLAQTKWGIEYLFAPNKYNSSDVFIEQFLFNRSMEIEKKCLESKFELNRLLLVNFDTNEDLTHLIGDFNLIKLKQYVSEGPFNSKSESRIAFESA